MGPSESSQHLLLPWDGELNSLHVYVCAREKKMGDPVLCVSLGGGQMDCGRHREGLEDRRRKDFGQKHGGWLNK